MLTKIEVLNPQSQTLSLPLQNATPGYTITEIDGLDPVKATYVSSTFAQLDGAQYQAARREIRNMVLKIAIEPYFGVSTVAQLRSALYAYFMPKTQITINFFFDGSSTASYTIKGRVESCEAALFSKNPEVAVSILCFSPNFEAITALAPTGNAAYNGTEQTITNPGTVESGYVLQLNVNRSITGFSILNRRPNNDLAQLDVSLALVSGDVVKISTEPNNKYATLTRSSVTSSILYAVSTNAVWGPLWPGANYVKVAIPTGATIPFTITYTPKYGGL